MKARSIRTLENLPLFATDLEIAEAVVGPERAADWVRDHLPKLETQHGFPGCERTHGGRYTPAVKAFYDSRYNLKQGMPGVDRPENPAAWTAHQRRRAS